MRSAEDRPPVADLPWDDLPMKYLPCPERQFKPEPGEQPQISPQDYLALVSVPKEYKLTPERCEFLAQNVKRDKKRIILPSEQQYVREFLSELMKILPPETAQDLLINEFGLSSREAGLFINEQKAKVKTGGFINVEARKPWLKEYKRIMKVKLIDYVATAMSARRSRRTRHIAATILQHFCDLTGEHCCLNNAQNRVQRIQVFIADRLASWLANVMAETDKELCKEFLEKSANDFGPEEDEGTKKDEKKTTVPKKSSKKPQQKTKETDDKKKSGTGDAEEKRREDRKRKKKQQGGSKKKQNVEKKRSEEQAQKKEEERKKKEANERKRDEQRKPPPTKAGAKKQTEEKRKQTEEKRKKEAEEKSKLDEERKNREKENVGKSKVEQEQKRKEEQEEKRRKEEEEKGMEGQEEKRRKEEEETRKKEEGEIRKKDEEEKGMEGEEGEGMKEEASKQENEEEKGKKDELGKEIMEDEDESRKQKEEDEIRKQEEEEEEIKKKLEGEGEEKGTEGEKVEGQETEPEEGAGDVLATKDPLDEIEDWAHETTTVSGPERESVAKQLEEDIKAELGKELSPEEEKVVSENVDKYSKWIVSVIDVVEKEMKSKGGKITYHIKRAKDKCHYDVKRVEEKKMCDMTKVARLERVAVISESICKRPESRGPMKDLKEMKEWAQWAADVVNLADKWVSWIDKTCQEADAKGTGRKPGDEEWEKNWKEFKKTTESGALELRRNKKYAKQTAKIWGEKFSSKDEQ